MQTKIFQSQSSGRAGLQMKVAKRNRGWLKPKSHYSYDRSPTLDSRCSGVSCYGSQRGCWQSSKGCQWSAIGLLPNWLLKGFSCSFKGRRHFLDWSSTYRRMIPRACWQSPDRLVYFVLHQGVQGKKMKCGKGEDIVVSADYRVCLGTTPIYVRGSRVERV